MTKVPDWLDLDRLVLSELRAELAAVVAQPLGCSAIKELW
jgi:hypothetical protein